MGDSDEKETRNEGLVSGSGYELTQFIQSVKAEMRLVQNGARQANLLCGRMRISLCKAVTQIHELDKFMEDLDAQLTVLWDKMEHFGKVDPSRGPSGLNPVWLMNIEARKLVLATPSSPSSKLMGYWVTISCFVF
jgi:hypothetical protein